MKVLCVDAFTDKVGGGNPAGVAFLKEPVCEAEMRRVAAAVGYSETAFVVRADDAHFAIRYFTPVEEVDLCGHATMAVFNTLFGMGEIADGREYSVQTKAGVIAINMADGLAWMDMAEPRELRELTTDECETLYRAYSLPVAFEPGLAPAIVSTGLPDIMMNVPDIGRLAGMKCDLDAITELSKKCGVTGVHAFSLVDEKPHCQQPHCQQPHCRNYAPLYGINEEAATGTSNGALTYYLYKRGRIRAGESNLFIQGEAMGRPSRIFTTLADKPTVKVRVGGQAVVNKEIEV